MLKGFQKEAKSFLITKPVVEDWTPTILHEVVGEGVGTVNVSPCDKTGSGTETSVKRQVGGTKRKRDPKSKTEPVKKEVALQKKPEQKKQIAPKSSESPRLFQG